VAIMIVVFFSLFICFSRSISSVEFSLSRLDVGSSARVGGGCWVCGLKLVTFNCFLLFFVFGGFCGTVCRSGLSGRQGHYS